MQRTEITARDFVRALQRYARVGIVNGATDFYGAVAGFDAYAQGTAATIQGLETPNAHTLVVRLTKPEGDLAYRLSIPAISPLPPLRSDPGAPYGVATGHDAGDGGLIVSSGPYMINGADKVDFTRPPAKQQPPRGLLSGKSITLVRNPSWSTADDSLRPAHVDRIVLTYGGSVDQAAAAIDAEREDLAMAAGPPPQVPLAEVSAWEGDPSRGHVDIQSRNTGQFVSMNLSAPPFDDIHVRRAVAYALDRAAIQRAYGGEVSGSLSGHLAPDSMENDALLTYDPYRSPDAATRLRRARQEMALSAYDSRHAGACDAAVCAHIPAIALSVPNRPPAALDAIVTGDLADIGIHVDIMRLPPPQFFRTAGNPRANPSMDLYWPWLEDYLNGGDFFVPLYDSSTAIAAGQDFSEVGASPAQLTSWGRPVRNVPSVDARISSCVGLVGDPQTRCWTSVDEYMMEKVIAVIPLIAQTYVELVPRRVVHYSFDQSNPLPALDQVAIQH